MGLFQPTTPISAGAAQVFDTSGIISLIEQQKATKLEQEKYRYAQRQKAEERLMKSKREFDPNGLHVRDIPRFQEKISEYEKFLSENHTELASSTQNIELVHRKRAMENDIREFMAGSMDFNKKSNAQTNIVLTNPRFNTDANKKLLSDALDRPPNEAYDDYSAFQTPDLSAQYYLEPEKYLKAVERIRVTDKEARDAEGVIGAGYWTISGDYYYDKQKTASALAPYWGITYDEAGREIEDPNPNSQQKEVRDRYKTMDNFVDAIIAASEPEAAEKMLRKPAEPRPRAITKLERERPVKVSEFRTQGRTAATIQTGTKGLMKTPVYGEVTLDDSDIVLNYDSRASWNVKNVKKIVPPGDMGGFDVSSGIYKKNLGKHIAEFDVHYMSWMDYAKQPMYAVFNVPGVDGRMTRAVKKIEAGGLIPKEAVELHAYSDDISPDVIV